MGNRTIDIIIVEALEQTEGISRAALVADDDRAQILVCEEEAEKRSLMGLGKVINTGVREILTCDAIYVALTHMSFDWGCHATLVLKKGDQIVGEEVREPARLEELRKMPNAWFMHKNFVIYKDRINFPQDVMRKICHFEIPGLAADWLRPQGGEELYTVAGSAVPATLGDMFLKERYFDGCDAHGTGTLLLGIDW